MTNALSASAPSEVVLHPFTHSSSEGDPTPIVSAKCGNNAHAQVHVYAHVLALSSDLTDHEINFVPPAQIENMMFFSEARGVQDSPLHVSPILGTNRPEPASDGLDFRTGSEDVRLYTDSEVVLVEKREKLSACDSAESSDARLYSRPAVLSGFSGVLEFARLGGDGLLPDLGPELCWQVKQ